MTTTITEDRCELSDLLISQCAHCRGHHDPIADLLAAETIAGLTGEGLVTGTAKQGRSCPSCRAWIDVGDMVALDRGEDGRAKRWICGGCVP